MQRAVGFVAAASVERLGAQMPTATGVKTVRTNVLEIGYHESGDVDGFPVILLHGFPDDAHAYDGVMPALANAGFRAFAVYLRGYGPTRFLDPIGVRTAEQAAIGQDVIDFADALRLPRFAVAGFDWEDARMHCVGAASRSRPRGRPHWRLPDSEHGDPGASRCARSGPQALVSVVLQHKRRSRRSRPEPARALRADVAGVVADLALQRRDVQSDRAIVRQPRLRGLRDPLVPPPELQRAGRACGLSTSNGSWRTGPAISVPAIVLHGGDDAFGRPSAEITAAERATIHIWSTSGSSKEPGTSSLTRSRTPWSRPC